MNVRLPEPTSDGSRFRWVVGAITLTAASLLLATALLLRASTADTVDDEAGTRAEEASAQRQRPEAVRAWPRIEVAGPGPEVGVDRPVDPVVAAAPAAPFDAGADLSESGPGEHAQSPSSEVTNPVEVSPARREELAEASERVTRVGLCERKDADARARAREELLRGFLRVDLPVGTVLYDPVLPEQVMALSAAALEEARTAGTEAAPAWVTDSAANHRRVPIA